MESYALLIAATLNAGTVLAIAALGLLINEKVGVVNLGAEGMMLCAAIAGFAAVVHTGSDMAGFLAGMGAGALLGAIFGVMVIYLGTNQYATGLALSLFGVGFSAFVGISYVQEKLPPRAQFEIPLGKYCHQLCRLNLLRWQCSSTSIEVGQKAKPVDLHFWD